MHITKIQTMGWQKAIEGLRFSFDSEDKTDSIYHIYQDKENGIQVFPILGIKDLSLMEGLIAKGSSHRKFLRALHVQMNVKMTMSWWKQFDTYKIATTSLSRSTMHTITKEHLTKNDFNFSNEYDLYTDQILNKLNNLIDVYKETKSKKVWDMIIDYLPMCYLQERMIDCNYETLLNIIFQREGHKLSDWQFFIYEVKEKIPYLINFYKKIKGENV
jgi:hypothetical protein